RSKFLDRDDALRSEFAGTAFPALNTPGAGDPAPVDGQRCFRLDELKSYQRRGGAWLEIPAFFNYTTSTALRSIDAAAVMADGAKARLLGLAAKGDVPGIDVEWSAASTATDDGLNVWRPSVGIAATGVGRWLRVNNDVGALLLTPAGNASARSLATMLGGIDR